MIYNHRLEVNMGIDWDGWMVAFFFTGICVFVMFVGTLEDKRRKNIIKKYCDEHGFAFNDSPKPISQNYKSYHLKNDERYKPKTLKELYLNTGYKFDIFNCGEEQTYSVGMYKNLGDFEIDILNFGWLYEYFYDAPLLSPETSKATCIGNRFILCQIKCKIYTFPDFYIRKLGFMDNFKYDGASETNIVIEKDKDFSDKFILNSSEPYSAIEFFNNDNVRNAFEKYSKKGFSYKANGEYFLVYREDNNDFDVNKRLELMESGLAIIKEITQYKLKYEEKILSKSQMKKKAKRKKR